jgi:hypothetical protein
VSDPCSGRFRRQEAPNRTDTSGRNWTGLRNALDELHETSLRAYVTISSTPAHAKNDPNCSHAETGSDPCEPDIGKWKDFLEELFTEFQDETNVVWGIWNEPNVEKFFLPNNASDYADVFIAADEARDATDSDGTVWVQRLRES